MPNPMPESVTDRPTKAHEYLFLLSKGPRYWYDREAIREPVSAGNTGVVSVVENQGGTAFEEDGKPRGALRHYDEIKGPNKRSVWTVATQPSYAGAHFATFPPKLIEPCILAGSPPKCCGACGAPWRRVRGARVLDLSRPQARRAQEIADEAGLTDEHIDAIRACGVTDAGKAQVTQDGFGHNDEGVAVLAAEAKAALGGYHREFLLARPGHGGWEPTCDHDDDTGRSVVLDPFAGAGTTGVVAGWHGRDFIGCELNPEYAQMARDRIALEGRPGGPPNGHEASSVGAGQASIFDLLGGEAA